MTEQRPTVVQRLVRLLGRLVNSVNPAENDRYTDDGPPAAVFRRRAQLDRYKRPRGGRESHAELYERLKRNRFTNVLDTYHILEHGHMRKPPENDPGTDEPERS